jgi:hypothetical protein
MKYFPYFFDSVYQFISLSFFIVNLYSFLHFWSIIHVIECLLSVSQLEKSYFILVLIPILFLDFVLSFWDINTMKHLWLSQVLLNTNKTAPAVTLLTCTWEVPGSNLDYGTTNPYWGFSWFSLVPSCNWNCSTINSSQLLPSRYFQICHLIITGI